MGRRAATRDRVAPMSSLPSARRRATLGGVGLTSLLLAAHATNDAFTSMLAALLPTLQLQFGLSETILATLVATLSFSSSVTQPVFGALADRWGRRIVGAVGVMTSSALLSLMPIVPSVVLLFALLLFGGLGSAAFHPAGTAMARAAAGSRKGLVVGIFSAGGTLGLALGPLIIGVLIMNDVLSYSPWLMVPGLCLGAAMILFVAPQDSSVVGPRRPIVDFALLRGPVGALCAAGILRSVSFVTFTNAAPLWLVNTRGAGSGAPVLFWTLATFSFSAGLGGILVGALERRLSRELLIAGTMIGALVPLGLLFVLPVGGLPYYLAVALAGAMVNGGLPLMVVAAQDLAPESVGAASGLLMGFTWGTAGVLYIGIGALQELIGIGPAMAISFLTLIPGAWIVLRTLRRP